MSSTTAIIVPALSCFVPGIVGRLKSVTVSNDTASASGVVVAVGVDNSGINLPPERIVSGATPVFGIICAFNFPAEIGWVQFQVDVPIQKNTAINCSNGGGQTVLIFES